MATEALSPSVESFRTQLRGSLIMSSDPAYDTARRVWNGIIDKRPLMIAACAGAADVIATVKFARDPAANPK